MADAESEASTRASSDKQNLGRRARFVEHVDDDTTAMPRPSSPSEDARERLLQPDIIDPDQLVQDVTDFVHTYNLSLHLSTFKKAALLLNRSDTANLGLTLSEEAALNGETTSRWQQPRQLYFTVLTCSLGAVMQGWCQTGSNGATLGFPVAFDVAGESAREKIIVGAINAGPFVCIAVLGAWIASPINDAIGRRGAIFTGAVLSLIAVLGSALSQSWPQLLIARLLLGLGMGLNATTTSVYAAECAPAVIRGGLAVSWQMNTAFGIFLGFCANLAMINYGTTAWRLQLGSAFLPILPLLACIPFCVESPSWRIKAKDDYSGAFDSLRHLRNTDLQAARDVYSIHLQQHSHHKRSSADHTSTAQKLVELFTIPRIRRAAIAAGMVMLSQQLCGINIIAFYSSTIFSTAGFSTFVALAASCVFGFVNTLFALPAIYAMDKFGRRSLLLWTFPPMALCMAAAGLCFNIPMQSSWYLPSLSFFLLLFTILYSPGAGPVPFTYASEVFPLSHRELGMSLSVSTSSTFASVLSLTFPYLLAVLGPQGAFGVYAVGNVVAWGLTWGLVPEVKGLRLEEIDAVFEVGE